MVGESIHRRRRARSRLHPQFPARAGPRRLRPRARRGRCRDRVPRGDAQPAERAAQIPARRRAYCAEKRTPDRAGAAAMRSADARQGLQLVPHPATCVLLPRDRARPAGAGRADGPAPAERDRGAQAYARAGKLLRRRTEDAMNDLKLEIKRLIVEVLSLEDVRPEDIQDDAPLFNEGLGLDSIDALELGVALRKRYQIKLEANDAGIRDYFRNVTSLCRLVERYRGST